MALHRAINGILHRIAHQARSMLFFQHRHRDFAFAKALHFDLWLRFGQFLHHFGVKLCRRQSDGIGALQAFVQGFRNQHILVLYVIWCGWRDLNPHASRRQNLNLVRLPISPHPQEEQDAGPAFRHGPAS